MPEVPSVEKGKCLVSSESEADLSCHVCLWKRLHLSSRAPESVVLLQCSLARHQIKLLLEMPLRSPQLLARCSHGLEDAFHRLLAHHSPSHFYAGHLSGFNSGCPFSISSTICAGEAPGISFAPAKPLFLSALLELGWCSPCRGLEVAVGAVPSFLGLGSYLEGINLKVLLAYWEQLDIIE